MNISLKFKSFTNKETINPLQTSDTLILNSKADISLGFIGTLFNKSTRNTILIDIESSRSRNIYDIGLVILNKEGLPVLQKCFILEENINYIPKSKYKSYLELASKSAEIISIKDLFYQLSEIIKKYKVNSLVSYNIGFDYSLINELATKSGFKNPFEDLNKLCLWKGMKNFLISKTDYGDWCSINNKKTATGKLSSTLQNIIQYLTNDLDFKQTHCSVSDLFISALLFRYLILQKKSLKLLNKVKLNHKTISKKYAQKTQLLNTH